MAPNPEESPKDTIEELTGQVKSLMKSQAVQDKWKGKLVVRTSDGGECNISFSRSRDRLAESWRMNTRREKRMMRLTNSTRGAKRKISKKT